MTMSVTITDEQYADLMFYARELKNGNTFDVANGRRRYFTESRHHYDRLCILVDGCRKSTADETEAEIRAKLLIWSPPSCP
jgi:hypothetical protein